jgi:DNA-binding NarL/FixJ family response regulator
VAGDGLHAVAEAERSRPNLALVEANLPNCDGVRAARLIRERVPGCRVLVLSEEEDEGILIDSIRAGASGYLTKESPLEDLIDAARVMHRGEALIPGRLLAQLLPRLVRRQEEQDRAVRQVYSLTRRERQVLALLAEGADNDRIAQALVISPQTARTHIQRLLGKLGFHSRLEAAAFVMRTGIHDELVGATV